MKSLIYGYGETGKSFEVERTSILFNSIAICCASINATPTPAKYLYGEFVGVYSGLSLIHI